jgi:hypothetical protein
MVAKIRSQLRWHNVPEFSVKFPNILVSGCSYTWNNSEEHVCTWPYYLQKIAGFTQILDCSQPGGGSNHIFNSVINEIETNPIITTDNTLVIVMWSGLSRTDVIAETGIVKKSRIFDNGYNFNGDYSTLTIFKNPSKDLTSHDEFIEFYHRYSKIISPESQIYESYIKIIALDHYLRSLGFSYFFLNWENLDQQFNSDIPLYHRARDLISPLKTLGEFADDNDMRIPNDGHPTADCHLRWCREILIPFLKSQNFVYQ